MPWGIDPCDPKEGLATLQQQFSMQRALRQEMFHGSAKQDWTKALLTGCSHHLQVPASSANRPFPAPLISGLSKPRTTTERWGSEKAACTTGLVRQSCGARAKSSESDLQTWHVTQLRVTWPATASPREEATDATEEEADHVESEREMEEEEDRSTGQPPQGQMPTDCSLKVSTSCRHEVTSLGYDVNENEFFVIMFVLMCINPLQLVVYCTK